MEKEKVSIFIRFHNYFQILGWAFIFFQFLFHFYNKNNSQNWEVLCITLTATQIVQFFQILDIIFSIFNMNGTKPLICALQISSRLITTFLFLNKDLPTWDLILILVPWSIADFTRYLYYEKKDSPMVGWFRYNLFLILYPLGVIGEISSFELGLQKNYQSHVLLIRILQITFILGLIFLYSHMLKARSKYLSNSKKLIIKK